MKNTEDLGWVKLHKKFLDSPIYQYSVHQKMPHLVSLWVHLLLNVNWTDKKWYDGKEEVNIPAGSLITSAQRLSEETGLTTQKVRTALEHYVNMGMITSKTTNRWTHLFIAKWTKYQSNNKDDGKQDNKQITTTKEYKNTYSRAGRK